MKHVNQQQLNNILADVVLWDVGSPTSICVMLCPDEELKAVKEYLSEHGYNVSANRLPSGSYHEIEITRK